MTSKRNLTLAAVTLIAAGIISGAAFAQGSGGGGGGGGAGGGGAGGADFSSESAPIIAAAVPPTYPRPNEPKDEMTGCSAQSAGRIDLPVAMTADLCESY